MTTASTRVLGWLPAKGPQRRRRPAASPARFAIARHTAIHAGKKQHGAMRLLAGLIGLAVCANAQSIRITAPTQNSTISGFSYQFTCSVSAIANLAYVEYSVDGETVGYAKALEPQACPSLNWNTYYVGNGSGHVVDATAYDATGRPIASATEVTGVHVENWLPQKTCQYSDVPSNACTDVDVITTPAASINLTPNGNGPSFSTITLTLKPSGGSPPSLVGSPSTFSGGGTGASSVSSPARTITSTANYIVVYVNWFNPNGAHISALQDSDGVNLLTTGVCTPESVAGNDSSEVCFIHPSTTHGTANYQVTATWTGQAGLGIHVFEVQNVAASTPQDVTQNDTASTGGVTRLQLVSKGIPMTVPSEWMLWCVGWSNYGTGAVTAGANWALDLGGATDYNNACEYRAEPTNWDGQQWFSATVNGSNSGVTNKAFQLYVDGQLVGSSGPVPTTISYAAPGGYQSGATGASAATITFWLDTSRYYNQPHKVAIVVSGGTCSNCSLGTWTTMGTWERQVTFSNSATPVELTTNARDQKIVCPGAIPGSCTTPVATLTGTIHYADGSTSSATVSCTSQNAAAVTVSGCTLTPVALGSAQIKVTDSTTGLPRVSWAYVMAANNYPNVGIDGTIQSGYVPGNSNFRRTGFFSAQMLADHQHFGYSDAGYPAAQEVADMAAGGYNGAEVALQAPPGLPGSSAPSTETAYHTWAHAETSYICSILGPLGPYFVGDSWVPSNGIYYGSRGFNLTNFITPSFQWLWSDWQSTCAHATRSNEMSDEITSVLTQGTQPCGATDTGCTIGSGDITQVACTAGTNCVASCTGAIGCKIVQDQFFIVTGSGTGLDYPTAATGTGPAVPVGTISNSAPGCLYNRLNACLTWPNPGVGTITYTATSNNCGAGGTSSCANLKIEPNIVNATFQGAPNYLPCNGVGGAAPCFEYTHSNAFMTYYSQALAGNPKAIITYAPSGQFSPNPLNEQRWCGSAANVCDYYWSGTNGYLPTRSSLKSLNDLSSTIDDINLMGGGFRNNYGLFGTKPTSVEATGITVNYAMTGYPVAVTSCSGDTCVVPNHGLANVINGFARLWITGSTGANGLYMIRATPDANHIQLVKAVPDCHPCGGNTFQTVTFDDSNSYTLALGDTDMYLQTGGCSNPAYKSERGRQFTASTAPWSSYTWWYDIASSDVCTDNWNYADFIWQVPTGSSALNSTGGTAYIIPDDYMVRGRSWEGNGENGHRVMFASINYGTILGADGSRQYIYGAGGNPMAFDRTQKYPFGWQIDGDRRQFSNTTTNLQAAGGHQVGVHPRYDIANSKIAWHATSLAQILQNRLAKYSMQPWLVSPDLGEWYEAAVRQDGSGNRILMIQQFADAPTSVTVDLRPYKITGRSIIRYLANCDDGIQVSTLPSNTSVDTISSKDGWFVAYIFDNNPTEQLSEPTISAQLSDVPNATRIQIRFAYTPYAFEQQQDIIPEVFDCGTGNCTLPVDLQIGHVYYKVTYLDSSGVIIADSDVQQL